MQATYIGSPDDPQTQEVSQYGLSFHRGDAVDIGTLNAFQVGKLKGNPTFEVSDDTPKKGRGKVQATGQAQVEIPADFDKLDDAALLELANKIDPTLGEDATREVTTETVEAELGRRAAAQA
jgi:hypothetical protein